MNSQAIINLLALATLITNVGFLLILVWFVASKFNKKLNSGWSKFESIIGLNSVKIAFAVSLTATLGSLYFSEFAGFEPCKLCWLQRIFMYPLPFILGIAIYKKLKDVWNYVLPLTIAGFAIAAYHYYYQVTGSPLIPCSTVGFSVSCSERFFTYYGYITIPWMSLSAFALVTFFMLLAKSDKA